MGDSDDEYESSGKRRGQSRNKFRNEREDSNNSANGDSVNEMDARKLSKTGGGHGDSKDRSHHSSSNSRRRHANSNFDEDDDEMHHRKNQRYSHGYGANPMSQQMPGRQMSAPNQRANMNYFPPEMDYRHDDMGMMGPGGGGYKRPFMEQGYFPNGNNPNMPYNNNGFPGTGPSSYYDTPNKKARRDWSVLERSQSSGYYEHDNRMAPEYDDYGDEYNDDYTRLNRPPNYGSAYNNGNKYDMYDNGNMDPYNNGRGGGGYPNQPYPQMNKKFNQTGGNMMNNDVQMFMNTMAPLVNSMAPMMNQGFNFNNNNNMPFGNNNMNYQSGGHFNKFNNSNQNNVNKNNASIDMSMSMVGDTQPQMMAYKQFLSTLSPKTTPEQANKAYNEYKNKFRREQIALFFQAHKHEEWFRFRYHPDDSSKKKEEQRESIKRRMVIFKKLLDKYEKEDLISLDTTDELDKKKLFKFLDAAMILLEDGSDKDLEILEEMYDLTVRDDACAEVVSHAHDEAKNGDEKAQEVVKEEEEAAGEDIKILPSSGEIKELELEDGEKNEEKPTVQNGTHAEVQEKPEQNGTGAKQEENAKKRITLPQKTQSIFFKHLPVIVTRADLEKIGEKFPGFKRAAISEPAPERRFQRRGWITFDSTVNIKEICSKINGMRLFDMMLNTTINRELDQRVKCISGLANHNEIIRNDLRSICKVVESMDKRWGLWEHSNLYNQNKKKEDQLNNKLTKEMNKKPSKSDDEKDAGETSAKNNGVDGKTEEKKETDDGASNAGAEQNDKVEIELENNGELDATIEKLDTDLENNSDEISEDQSATENRNPLLYEALEYLSYVNEQLKLEKEKAAAEAATASATETSEPKEEEKVKEEPKVEPETVEKEEKESEEKTDENSVAVTIEEEVKLNDDLTEKEAKTPTPTTTSDKSKLIPTNKVIKLEKDVKGAKLLDKLIMYLRLVHSIDYYNATEYQQEDYMPNRCGVLHVRSSSELKSNSSTASVISNVNINYFDPNAIKRVQIDEWIRLFDIHIKSYVDYRDKVDPEVAKRLGLKEEKEEIDKFISANCQKIEKNIWLCPLSGKKFKGPDYVRKHIETKHSEKLAELKKEVDYFNRFVFDPKRPYLPEHPLSKNTNQQGYNNNMPMMQNSSYNQYSDYGSSYSSRSSSSSGYSSVQSRGSSYSSMPYNNGMNKGGFNPNFNDSYSSYHSSYSQMGDGYNSGYNSHGYSNYSNNGSYGSNMPPYNNRSQAPMNHQYNNKLPRR